jgi:hypothetical protein
MKVAPSERPEESSACSLTGGGIARIMGDQINLSSPPRNGFLGLTWTCDDYVLDFVQGEGGRVYREADGSISLWRVADFRPKLSNAQTLRIIEAAGVAVPGWPDGLPPEWYDSVWIKTASLPQKPHAPSLDGAAYHKFIARPRSVRRSFNALLHATDALYSSLARRPTRSVAGEIRTKTKKLRSAKLTAEALLLAPNLRSASADIERLVKRYELQADCLETEPRPLRALEQLTPHLILCFEQIFCRAATGGWHPRESLASDDADSPYVRFARAYLSELGCGHRPLTIQKALYEGGKAKRKST